MLDIDSLYYIFSYLSVKNRQQNRLVCKKWQQVVDQIVSSQKSLVIKSKTGSSSDYDSGCDNTCDLVIWPRPLIKYSNFCLILKPFNNLHSLSFHNIEQFCDPYIRVLTQSCPKLIELEFISCSGLCSNKWNDFMLNYVTDRGWQELSAAFGGQLKKLTLQDCEITDSILEFIIDNFTLLEYLDVTKNSSIRNGQSLSRLGPKIKIIKLGPDLNNEVTSEISLNSLSLGNGSHIVQLNLYTILSPQFRFLSRFTNLKTLVIHFFKGPSDLDLVDYFSPIGQISTLVHLELYQIHCYDSIMAINSQQLSSIVKGCKNLKVLIIKSHYWCESFFNQSFFKLISENLCQLETLEISPGNCLVNNSIVHLIKLKHLKSLSLSSFSSLTDNNLTSIITNCPELSQISLSQCWSVTSNLVCQSVSMMRTYPKKRLTLTLRDCNINLKDNISTQHLPPNITIQIIDQQQQSENKKSIMSFIRLFFSLLSFISTTMTITLTITLYFVHEIIVNYVSPVVLLIIMLFTIVPVLIIAFHAHSCLSSIMLPFHFNFFQQNNLNNVNQLENFNNNNNNNNIHIIDYLFDMLISLMSS